MTRIASSTEFPAIQPFNGLDIARNIVPGQMEIHKFGHSDNVGTSETDINHGQTGIYTWLQAAVTLEAISDSGLDTDGGDGAHKITVEGLDANFVEISEEITMAGLSASAPTSASFRRIHRAFISVNGAYHGNHVGIITIRTSGVGATHIVLADDPPAGQSEVARFTIPAGKTGYLMSMISSVDSKKTTDIYAWRYENADDVSTPFSGAKRTMIDVRAITESYTLNPKTPIAVLPGKTDIWFSALVTSGPAAVGIDFEIIMVDD